MLGIRGGAVHLNFLDTSPLKVFASGTRGRPEVYMVNPRFTWSTGTAKGVSVSEVCIVDRGIPGLPSIENVEKLR